MSETLFNLEFYCESEEPFACCVAMCVPRIGEKVSLYEVTHQGHHDYRVVDIDYLFDVRTDRQDKRQPYHWGLQSVSVYVRKETINNISCSEPFPEGILAN